MHITQMTDKALGWVVSAALVEAQADPRTWNPTANWQQVELFWKLPGAGCHRVPASRMPAASCLGVGDFEATCESYVARANTPLVAICRVLAYRAFGPSVDLPNGVR